MRRFIRRRSVLFPPADHSVNRAVNGSSDALCFVDEFFVVPAGKLAKRDGLDSNDSIIGNFTDSLILFSFKCTQQIQCSKFMRTFEK